MHSVILTTVTQRVANPSKDKTYLVHIGVGEEVVHVEQDVEELGAHAAVAEQRVDRVVPAQQRVAMGQRLRGLVVSSHTRHEIVKRNSLGVVN